MRLREEIGDLAAGFDVPIRHAVVAHLLLGIARELAALLDLALTHRLHGLEGERGLETLGNERDHDVVTAADGLVNTGCAAHDQIADIARPHIRTMGKPRKADEGIKLLGLRLHQHLPGKARAEFGDTKGSRYGR